MCIVITEMRYPDDLTLRQARSRYFELSGFGTDGNYNDKWVRVKLGFLPLYFPNSQARIRAVKIHDLHHVLADYSTTLSGETEIGAWEIGSGCGRHLPAWVLNLAAWAIGLVMNPSMVCRAYARGRRSGNLYSLEVTDELLSKRVGELRAQLPVRPKEERVSSSDIMGFLLWSALAILLLLLIPFMVIAIGLVVWL